MKHAVKPSRTPVSGRELGRMEACLASGVYRLREKEKPSFGAWWGIFLGRFLEYAKKHDREYALDYIEMKQPKMLKTCSAIDVDSIPDGLYEPEYALDTQQREAYELPWKEALERRHLHTRADLVFQDERELWNVADYKSGKRVYDPSNDSQLLTLGTKVWLINGAGDDDVIVSFVNVHSDGTLHWTPHTLTPEFMDRYLVAVRRTHVRVLNARDELQFDGIEPPFTPGKQCNWCPIRTVCDHATAESKKEKR